MSAARYFTSGAEKGLAGFFGDAKRLRLIEAVATGIQSLHQNLQRPLKILDIGAGTGMHAYHFAKMGHTIIAVDPVEKMLLEGQKLYQSENLKFVVDALPKLEKIQNEKFDLIYSVAAWQYIKPEERQAAMNRIAELLQPGGLLFIVWPVPMSREFQFPLISEDLCCNIEETNKKLPENQRLSIAMGEPIADPDGRTGFVEKTEKVYFHILSARLPALELHNKISGSSPE